MKKLHRVVIIAILAIFMGLLSGSYLNSIFAVTGCDNFGCGYEPINHEFRCWGIDGATACQDGGGDCSDINCGISEI